VERHSITLVRLRPVDTDRTSFPPRLPDITPDRLPPEES